MTDWSQIHSDVHIGGADGFSFITMSVPMHDWRIDQQSKEEKEFVELCLPGHKPRMIAGVERPYEPYNALRMYLCESMSYTFALSEHQGKYYIGVRSKKDLFKLNLKFDECDNIKMWDSKIKFYVRTAKDDTFSDKGTLKRMQAERYHV